MSTDVSGWMFRAAGCRPLRQAGRPAATLLARADSTRRCQPAQIARGDRVGFRFRQPLCPNHAIGLRKAHRSPSTRMAMACPTGPAEFSNVMFSAAKSSASIWVEGVRKVPIGLPSKPVRLAFRSKQAGEGAVCSWLETSMNDNRMGSLKGISELWRFRLWTEANREVLRIVLEIASGENAYGINSR